MIHLAETPPPEPSPCFLGVDGGGTHTRAVLVDAGGQEIGRGQAGGANWASRGVAEALANIHRAVTAAREAAGVAGPARAAWCGLAGVDRPADREQMAPGLRDLAATLRLTNDAELALAVLPDTAGVCLVAGTGSIAVGRATGGRTARAGGWGHVLGDEGSGYDIGRQALQAVARAADGRGPATALTGAILAAWDLAEPSALIGQVYGGRDPTALAALAQPVFATAQAGDPLARAILARAARELAIAALAVAARLGWAGPLPLALTGGLLLGRPAFADAVVAEIRRERPVGPVVAAPDPAHAAALALAREHAASRDAPA
jgi:glucosamine kinase